MMQTLLLVTIIVIIVVVVAAVKCTILIRITLHGSRLGKVT